MKKIGQMRKDMIKDLGIAVSPDMIRRYEDEGLVKASSKTGNGYRWYDKEAENQIRTIAMMRSIGMEISEIKRVMKGNYFEVLNRLAHIETIVAPNIRSYFNNLIIEKGTSQDNESAEELL